MRRAFGWFWRTGFLSTFLAGLFAVLPIVITVGIMASVGGLLQAWLGPESFVGKALFQLGLRFVTDPTVASVLGWVAVLLAIWLLGALLKSVGKKRIETAFDAAVERIRSSTFSTDRSRRSSRCSSATRQTSAGHERRLLRFGGEGGAGFLGLLVSDRALPLQRPGVPDRLRADLAAADVWSVVFAAADSVHRVDMQVDDLMKIVLHRGDVLEGDPRPIRRPAPGGGTRKDRLKEGTCVPSCDEIRRNHVEGNHNKLKIIGIALVVLIVLIVVLQNTQAVEQSCCFLR